MGHTLKDLELTPQHLQLLDAATEKSRLAKGQFFRLMIEDDQWPSVADMPDGTVVAYALITAASRGKRRGTWVMLKRTVRESRTRQWWRRAEQRLVDAGLLSTRRTLGQATQYLLALPPASNPIPTSS